MNTNFNRRLHRFACLLAFATFILIVAGANVTSHRAGLAVPDWPTTYGQFMFSFPMSKWVGNILYEHGHRLIASTVGMLTTVLAIWLVRGEPRRWVRRLGIAAVAAVVAQGILGGLTVIFMLPPPISIAHASLAEAFFCMTVTLAVVTSEKWMQPVPSTPIPQGRLIRRILLTTTIAIYAQIILGAAIRHAEVGILAHIIGAAIVFGCVVAVTCVILLGLQEGGLSNQAVLLACLIVSQIGLGLVTLLVRVPKNVDGQLSTIQVIIPTAHLAMGALILATSLSMTLKAYRFLSSPAEEAAVPFGQRVLP